MNEAEIRKIVAETVKETLTRMGIEADEPFDVQKDMAFVRNWRTSSEAVKRQSILIAVGVVVTGLIGMVWMVLKGN